MKGMEPPWPMSTQSRPKAVVRAQRAARDAGVSAGASKAGPVSPGVTLTRAPKGACASRCAVRADRAEAGSWPGAMRRDRRAVQEGASTLPARSRGVTSMPMTVRDGLVHSRAVRSPVPISPTPSRTPASARKSASG